MRIALLLVSAVSLASTSAATVDFEPSQLESSSLNKTSTVYDASTIADPRLNYYINGSEVPGVSNFTGDVGTMYGGMVPIDHNEAKRSMYFFYTPIIEEATQGKDDLLVWFNGGPGCEPIESSTDGLPFGFAC